MTATTLGQIAIARSGDKGNSSNIGVMARSPALYDFLEQTLTADVVKAYFKELCFGKVTRYELPNLQSLNFILEDSLGGGGTETLITDAQGKVHGAGLLHLTLDVPDDLISGATDD